MRVLLTGRLRRADSFQRPQSGVEDGQRLVHQAAELHDTLREARAGLARDKSVKKARIVVGKINRGRGGEGGAL